MSHRWEAVYRALLLAYPPDFRHRFGPEMLQLVQDGELSPGRLIVDVLVTASQERWSQLQRRVSLPRVCTSLLTAALSASLLLMGHHHLFEMGTVPRPVLPNLLGALLPALMDPTVAFALMVAGLYGLIAEASTPGAVLPGTLGFISLAAGLASLAAMPVNYVGLALLGASIAVFVAGIKLPVHGILTDSGVVLFLAGSLALFNWGGSGLAISEPVVIVGSVLTAAFFGAIGRLAARARHQPATTGPRELLGKVGLARTPLATNGQVFVRGERWTAVCDDYVPAGTPVEIVAISGLTLTVRRLAA